MSDVALRTVGLGKMYQIGGEREQYRTLRDTLTQAAKRPIERIRHPGAATHRSEVLWALKDVDLEVKQGEVLGVIGRNGAGKSTLLKVLSHITEPTEGRAEVRGRVASLLEVGTGFHTELTGRENIHLNGAILGMTRAEIRRRFDDIVEFSDIGRFLDTPVKRYSSGMYVRLAFAVAAHLDPEILIVDEVLSVGDAGFQKKCLGKMEDVAGSGRTVLLVSHNMQAIRSLCDDAVEIEAGRVVNRGGADEVVVHYLAQQADMSASLTWPAGQGPGDEEARLVCVEVIDASGNASNIVSTTEPIVVRMEVDLTRVDDALCIGFDLATADGTVVARSYQTDASQDDWPALIVGRNCLGCTIPAGLLNSGRYHVMPRIGLHHVRWIVHADSAISFEAHRGAEASPYRHSDRPGTIAPVFEWRALQAGR
jgi:lipopolysaccharide transport system ATP-binding protein